MKQVDRRELAVLFALAMSQAPLSIPDLAKRTGRSYNTVKKVVTTDARVTAQPGHPTRYYLAMPDQLQGQVIRLSGDKPAEGWVKWLGKVRPKLGELTTLDKKLQLDEVTRQGMILEALGINLVSLGRELQDKADEPDWYSQIGGNEDDTFTGVS